MKFGIRGNKATIQKKRFNCNLKASSTLKRSSKNKGQGNIFCSSTYPISVSAPVFLKRHGSAVPLQFSLLYCLLLLLPLVTAPLSLQRLSSSLLLKLLQHSIQVITVVVWRRGILKGQLPWAKHTKPIQRLLGCKRTSFSPSFSAVLHCLHLQTFLFDEFSHLVPTNAKILLPCCIKGSLSNIFLQCNKLNFTKFIHKCVKLVY